MKRTAAMALVAAVISACGSKSGGGGGSGSGGASTGGGGAGGVAPDGGGAGTGGAAAGAGGAAAPTCLGLQAGAAKAFYTPTDSTYWVFVGADDKGTLLAANVNRSVRVVSIGKDGTAELLLDETTYTRSWPFDPTSMVALRRSDGVDVLVSDDARVTLVRKQGATVRVIELGQTNYLDLHALALAPGSAGTMAVFARADDTSGTATHRLTVLDLDPLLVANPTPANLSLGDAVNRMTDANRSFPGPAGLAVAATRSGVWITAERLDTAADCQPTGEVLNCGSSSPTVPWLDCALHVDAWHMTTARGLQAAPLATVEGRVRLSARCNDATTPAGLFTLGGNVGFSPQGIYGHHGIAVDPVTSRLGLVVQRQTMLGAQQAQFGLLDPSGTAVVSGVLGPSSSAGGAGAWLATRGDHVFFCPRAACLAADASAASAFQLDALETFTTNAVLQLPDGIGLLGPGPANDNALWVLRLACTH